MPEGGSQRRSNRRNIGRPPQRLIEGRLIEERLIDQRQGIERTDRPPQDVEDQTAAIEMVDRQQQPQGGNPPPNPEMNQHPILENDQNQPAAGNNAGQGIDPHIAQAINTAINNAVGQMTALLQPLLQQQQQAQQQPQLQQQMQQPVPQPQVPQRVQNQPMQQQAPPQLQVPPLAPQPPLPPPVQNLPVPPQAPAAVRPQQIIVAAMSTFPNSNDPMIDPRDPARGRLYQSMYNEAKDELKTKIDGKNLTMVISELMERCTAINCHDIFEVSTGSGTKNLLTRYGEITLPETRREATQRWVHSNWHTQARYLIGMCLLGSMTQAFKTRINQKKALYNMPPAQPDGPLIFKVMCDLIRPSTRNTTQTLVNRLQDLRPREFGNDIVKFNEAFTALKETIRAQQGGENSLTEELLYNAIMRAYKSVEQDEFKGFMSVKDNSGTIDHHEDLMAEAGAKFHSLEEDKSWSVPSQGQQLMAFVTTALSKQTKKSTDRERRIGKAKPQRDKDKRMAPPHDDTNTIAKRKKAADSFDRWIKTKPKRGMKTRL